MERPLTLLIVYHTHTGGTRQMAEAVRQGAQLAQPEIDVRLLHARDAGPQITDCP